MHYGCQVWGQNKNADTKKISSIQDKAIRMISLQLLIAEHLNQNLPSFGGYFTYLAECHSYNTTGALKKLVSVPPSKTTIYGIHSITAKSVRDWNTFQNKIAYEFYQDTVVTPKLVSALKAYSQTG